MLESLLTPSSPFAACSGGGSAAQVAAQPPAVVSCDVIVCLRLFLLPLTLQVLEAVRPRKSLRSHLRRVYNSAAVAGLPADSEVASEVADEDLS